MCTLKDNAGCFALLTVIFSKNISLHDSECHLWWQKEDIFTAEQINEENTQSTLITNNNYNKKVHDAFKSVNVQTDLPKLVSLGLFKFHFFFPFFCTG